MKRSFSNTSRVNRKKSSTVFLKTRNGNTNFARSNLKRQADLFTFYCYGAVDVTDAQIHIDFFFLFKLAVGKH